MSKSKPRKPNVGVNSPTDFAHSLLRLVASQQLLQAGADRVQARAADVLTELLARYLELLARNAKDVAETGGRTEANLADVGLVFAELGVRAEDLGEFCRLWLAEAEPPRDREEKKEKEKPKPADPGADKEPGEEGAPPNEDADAKDANAPDAPAGPSDPDVVQATQGNVLGKFVRLPPGPFPVNPGVLPGQPVEEMPVVQDEEMGESDAESSGGTRKRKRLPEIEDWMPELPKLETENPKDRDAKVDDAADTTAPAAEPDAPAPDTKSATQTRDNLLPFSESQLASLGRTFEPPLEPPDPDPNSNKVVDLPPPNPTLEQNLKDLDEALWIAMDAVRIAEPGPIGYGFDPLRNPDRYWDPTRGPPYGFDEEQLGKPNVRLMRQMARPMMEVLLRPGMSGIREMMEENGADLQPMFWQVPYTSATPAVAPAKPAAKPKQQQRKPAPRPPAVQRNLPRLAALSPTYVPSPLGVTSPTKDYQSPVLAQAYQRRGGRGEYYCVCAYPYEESGAFSIECGRCERWFHGALSSSMILILSFLLMFISSAFRALRGSTGRGLRGRGYLDLSALRAGDRFGCVA